MAKNKVIMIGVYQTNKIKNTHKTAKLPQLLPTNKNVVMEIDYAQSIYYLQFILKRVNQIEYQIASLQIKREILIGISRPHGASLVHRRLT